MQTETSEEAGVEISGSAVEDGAIILNVSKIWGGLEVRHRGDVFNGGISWVPDGQLPVRFGSGMGEELSVEQCAELFKDLLGVLTPSIKVFVKYVDEKESDF